MPVIDSLMMYLSGRGLENSAPITSQILNAMALKLEVFIVYQKHGVKGIAAIWSWIHHLGFPSCQKSPQNRIILKCKIYIYSCFEKGCRKNMCKSAHVNPEIKGIVGSHPRYILKTPLFIWPPSKIGTVRTRHRGFDVFRYLTY